MKKTAEDRASLAILDKELETLRAKDTYKAAFKVTRPWWTTMFYITATVTVTVTQKILQKPTGKNRPEIIQEITSKCKPWNAVVEARNSHVIYDSYLWLLCIGLNCIHSCVVEKNMSISLFFTVVEKHEFFFHLFSSPPNVLWFSFAPIPPYCTMDTTSV